jgi:hypothetical protein
MNFFVLKSFLLALSTAHAGWAVMQAQWVQRDYDRHTGVVEYLDQGADSVVDSRRSDAFKKMQEFCGAKKYRIVKEVADRKEYGGGRSRPAFAASFSDRGSGRMISLVIDSARTQFSALANYNYIVFKCSK